MLPSVVAQNHSHEWTCCSVVMQGPVVQTGAKQLSQCFCLVKYCQDQHSFLSAGEADTQKTLMGKGVLLKCTSFCIWGTNGSTDISCLVCLSETRNIQIETPNLGIGFGMYLLICCVSLAPCNSPRKSLNARCWKVQYSARSDPRAQHFKRTEQIKFTLQPLAPRTCHSCKPAQLEPPEVCQTGPRNVSVYISPGSRQCQEMQFCQMTALALNFSDKSK